jgi:hypothetical protein
LMLFTYLHTLEFQNFKFKMMPCNKN